MRAARRRRASAHEATRLSALSNGTEDKSDARLRWEETRTTPLEDDAYDELEPAAAAPLEASPETRN